MSSCTACTALWCALTITYVSCAYRGTESVTELNQNTAQQTTLAKEIRRTLRSFAHGSAADGLPPMDPILMQDIFFCRGYGVVRANICFPTSTLAGVSAVDNIHSVKCSQSTLSFSSYHSEIVQHGQYNLTGSFHEVLAEGKGQAHIILKNITILHQLRWRRARGLLRVRDYRGTVQPRHMTVHYQNLRSEVRELLTDECRHYRPVEDVNKYFNENWQVLYEAISSSVDFAFSMVFRDYMDAMLLRIENMIQDYEE